MKTSAISTTVSSGFTHSMFMYRQQQSNDLWKSQENTNTHTISLKQIYYYGSIGSLLLGWTGWPVSLRIHLSLFSQHFDHECVAPLPSCFIRVSGIEFRLFSCLHGKTLLTDQSPQPPKLISKKQSICYQLGKVVHAYNTSTQEAETGR